MRKVSSLNPTFGTDLPPGRELVLYVEDDDENWDVAKLRLDHSYALLRAEDAETACGYVAELGERISLILMDIELRGSELNGTELTELFRGKKLNRPLPAYARDLPVITKPIVFVTAHGARYSDVELMLFGADLVVPKPVNFASLRAALQALRTGPQGRGR